MCTVSMIMDHYWEKWQRPPYQPWAPTVVPAPSPITPEELAEFRTLLERAREYDEKNNEPECELEEKKTRLKTLAKKLGVEIAFL